MFYYSPVNSFLWAQYSCSWVWHIWYILWFSKSWWRELTLICVHLFGDTVWLKPLFFSGKMKIIAQQSSYLAGSDLSCLLLKWILQSSPRLAFLRNQTLSLFWWNTFVGTSLQPPSPASFSPLKSPVPQPPKMSHCSKCINPFVLFAHVLFPVFRMSLLHSGKLCPPLRSSSSVTSFIESFLAESHILFSAPRAPHSCHYFLNIYFVVFELFVYIYIFSRMLWTSGSRDYTSFTFVDTTSTTVLRSSVNT